MMIRGEAVLRLKPIIAARERMEEGRNQYTDSPKEKFPEGKQARDELTVTNGNLPANLEDLSKFVLVGREKLVAVRAAIRAIDKVGVAQEVRKQKLKEGQEIGEAVLDAEVRIGELMREVPKASGGDRRSENFKTANGGHFETKTEAVAKMMGMDAAADKNKVEHMIKRFETLAAHPEIVAQAKAEARENDTIVTRADVLEMVRKGQKRTCTFHKDKALKVWRILQRLLIHALK